MEINDYTIARLKDDQVDEVKQLERQLSDRSGHPVTLIAYEQAEDADADA
ncbi:hypothetical protein [Cohnella sp. 56]